MTTPDLNTLWVLVLNRSYEPLQICSGRRAVTMVLGGRAEAVEEDGLLVRSYTIALRLPTVIRLQRYIRIPRRGEISFSKRNVFRRDNHTCQYCGYHGKGMTIDHIIPRSRGGKTSWENVVAACQPCNSQKGNRTAEESRMPLLRSPRRPYLLFHQYVASSIQNSTLEAWQKYIEPYRPRKG
jgi:5-methylcytosine-specific restriction endonuclease McrA